MLTTVPMTRKRPGECGSVNGPLAGLLRGHVLAPDLRETQEETLLGREAVDVVALAVLPARFRSAM